MAPDGKADGVELWGAETAPGLLRPPRGLVAGPRFRFGARLVSGLREVGPKVLLQRANLLPSRVALLVPLEPIHFSR